MSFCLTAMDTPYPGQLEVCNTTFAPIANALAEYRETEPAWFEHIYYSYLVLATFVAGIMVGYRLGYRRGLQDGDPRLRCSFYRWYHDLDNEE